MSSVVGFPSRGCGLTTDGIWIEDTWSSVVGYEYHENKWRYRIKRYEFKTPTNVGGVNIVGISSLTLNFPDVNSYFWESGWNGSDMALYCYISTSSTVTINQIQNNIKEENKITFNNNNNNGWDSRPNSKTMAVDLKPGTTYYLYIHSNNPGIFRARYWPETGDLSISTMDITYTKCGAPTEVSINQTITAPGGNITLSWSGATSGTSNPISGYKIYYKYEENPTFNSYNGTIFVSTTQTNGSKIITIPEGNRGKVLYFGVQTIGSVSGYDSVNITSGVSTKINQLPSQPQVVLSSTKLPSTGGKITINSLSATDTDNQNISYYYSIADNQKRSVTQGASLSFNANTIVKFWSYDGLEYSSFPTETIIELNTKPAKITINNTPNNITANGISGYATNHNGSIVTDSRAIAAKIELIYNNIVVKTYGFSTANYSISDIESQLSQYYTNSELTYTLKFYAVDSLEAFYAGEITYKLPAAPNIISSIVDGNTVFYKKIIFTYYQDTSAISYSFSSKVNNINIIDSQNYEINTVNNMVTHTVNINSRCPSNTEVIFTLETQGGLTKKSTKTQRAGYIPNAQVSVNWGMTTFNPFQNTVGIKQVTSLNIQNPFTEGYNNYNIERIELRVFNNKGSKKIIIKRDGYTSDNLIFSISGDDIFGVNDFNLNTYKLKDGNGWSGIHALSAQIVIINNSNIEFPIINISNIYLNFDYPPASCDLTLKFNNMTNFIIQEGMSLSCDIAIHPYTKENINVALQYSFDKKNYQTIAQSVLETSNYKQNNNYGYYENGKIIAGEINSTLIFTMPKVLSTKTYWRLAILSEEIYSDILTKNSVKHTEIQGLQIVSGTKKDNALQIIYTFSQLGFEIDNDVNTVSSSYEATLTCGEVTSTVKLNQLGIQSIIDFIFDFESSSLKGLTIYPVILTIKHTASQDNYSNSKTASTPLFNIYVDVPTVSYRHNHIGINTSIPAEGSVLTISPAQGKNSIVLNTLEGTEFIVKTINGAILEGFIINCGDW